MKSFTETDFTDCDILLKDDPSPINDSVDFVYFCKDYKQVVDLAVSNEIDLTYATHEWHGFICKKIIEEIFCKNGATAVTNKLYKVNNIIINGVEFKIDIGVYAGENGKFQTRSGKNDFIKSLAPTENTIYVIISSEDIFAGKWALHDTSKLCPPITAFMQYYKDKPMNKVPVDNKNIFSEIISISA